MHGKKILFVITKSGWGGAQAYVYTLATAYAREGATVSVASGGGRGQLTNKLEAAGIEVRTVPSLSRDFSFDAEWKALSELRDIIRAEQPDVLHVNSSKAAGLGALAGRLEGIRRIVFTVHGWPHKEPGSYRRSALIWLASLATIILSHAVIVVSKADKKTTLGRFKKVVYIPLGIEPFSLRSKEDAREALGVPLDAFVLGTIAELTNNKGIEYGIRAFANLTKRGVTDRYVIIGEGELKGVLKALALELGVAKDVVFTGFLPDARSYLPAFDVFLLPSLKEGLPYVLLEARAAGTMIVASQVGGIPDALQGYKAGTLVPPKDVEAIVPVVVGYKKNPIRDVPSSDNFPLTKMLEETRALY